MLTREDWEARYQAGETPWEKGAGSPGLEDFLRDHPDLPRGTVLVPGCGTGHDVRCWARHGFRALGLDLADSAIRLATERTAPEDLLATFRQSDFLRGEMLGTPPVDWLFEHTLFCAIHPEERGLYAEAAARWVRPGGNFLAVHYMLREGAEGPPFGCSQEEIMERFSPAFDLIQGWIPRSYPNRVGLELVLWWRRR